MPTPNPSKNLGKSTRFRITSSCALETTPVFDTYWKFAARRQEIFMRRVRGLPPPWTDDRILATHRFTNVYRASDRVSQYLIREILYDGDQTEDEIFFRALLFKLFNRIETWELLRNQFGSISWRSFSYEHYAQLLDTALAQGERIYSAAYIMPSPSFANARKHRNHLQLLEHMMRDNAPSRVANAGSLRDVFELLQGYNSLGAFLAYQFTIDLNYSKMLDFPEMEFVVAGPGARDGIRKCFKETTGVTDADIIRAVTEHAESEFQRLNLQFSTLWGRPPQLIDCQNIFCEVAKYARAAHPEYRGQSGRSHIKQKFISRSIPIKQWYPPKWNILVPSFAQPQVPTTNRS